MTSTGQEDPAEGQDGLEPTTNKPEAQTEPRTVPVAAIAEQRQKTRDANERIAALEAELARIKESKGQAAPQKSGEVEEDLRATVMELKRAERTRGLVAELGLGSSAQADTVAKIIDSNPGLTPVEALDIAARRDPEGFKDRGQAGFDPSIHGSLRPTKGSQPSTEPPKSDLKKRFEYSDSLTVNKQKNAVRNNAIGHFAAQAIGFKEHQLIKLPD